MNNITCIRLWIHGSIPEWVQQAARVPDEDETGIITVFVAHVPAVILADASYRGAHGPEGVEGWMRDGELGLFGTNALETVPHPEGDGVLIVGSAI